MVSNGWMGKDVTNVDLKQENSLGGILIACKHEKCMLWVPQTHCYSGPRGTSLQCSWTAMWLLTDRNGHSHFLGELPFGLAVFLSSSLPLLLVVHSVCVGIFIVYSMFHVAFIKLVCSVFSLWNIFIFIQLFSLLVWLIGKLLACQWLFSSLYAINFPSVQFLFAFLLMILLNRKHAKNESPLSTSRQKLWFTIFTDMELWT